MSFGVDPRNPLEYSRINYFLMPCITNPRAPLTTDYNFQINTIWRVGKGPNGELPTTGVIGDQWILVDKSGVVGVNAVAVWKQFVFSSGSVGDMSSVSGDDSVVVGPDGSGDVGFTGNVVFNATHSKPVYFKQNSTNVEGLDVQTSTSSVISNINNAGLASFNAGQFNVDPNGYVSIKSGGISWHVVNSSTNPNPMLVENGYIASDNSVLTTLTLPSSAAVGDTIRILGFGTAGWKVLQNIGQTIHVQGSTTTTGTGYLQSDDQYDTIELICIVANTQFIAATVTGNINVM